jgi:hypothetical protein
MAQTLKFGNGTWATKKGSTLAYNDEDGNYKPLPFTYTGAGKGTRVNKQGLIEVVENDRPRIDYLDSEDGALLLEPARSNVLPHSNNYDEWAKGNSTVTSGQIGVGGSLDAWKLQKNASGGYVSRGGFSYDGVSTFSIFAKAGSVDWLRVTSQSGSFKFNVNLSNGEVGVTGSLITSTSVEYYGDGWYRCTATGDSLATGFYVKPAETDDDPSGVDGFIFIQNSQVETNSSYATSYIPTSGSAATRSADACNNGGNSTLFNNNSFTIFSEFIRDGFDTDSAGVALGLRNPSNSEQIRLHFDAPTKFVRFRDALNGFATIGGYIPISLNEKIKLSLSVNGSTAKVFSNGVQVGSDYTGITPFNIDEMVLNGRLWKVKDVRYYNTALTDAELIALTK